MPLRGQQTYSAPFSVKTSSKCSRQRSNLVLSVNFCFSLQDLYLLFIACHFIWVLFPGHFARWEEAVNAVMSVRPLMMLQGFDKDTKQCLQKEASSLITPEKQASLSLFFFF